MSTGLRNIACRFKYYPPKTELALAVITFSLWFLLDCFRVANFSIPGEFHLLAANLHWQPRWNVGPWLLGVGGFFAAAAQQHRGRLGQPHLEHYRRCLRQLIYLPLILIALRLLSLWNAASYLFPCLVLLWSPHTTWALCGSLLLLPQLSIRSRLSTRAIALSLFVGSVLVYATYTLYFCQMVMLHGDEGQYLRVTQSGMCQGL